MYSSKKLLRAVGSRTALYTTDTPRRSTTTACGLTDSEEDASDATQEAFVNVLRRLQDDDRPVLEFSSYLFAAARHESYALMRQRTRTHPSDSPPAERGRVADVDTDPERSVLLRDSQDAVRVANATLAPRHREVLALREVAGRSYEEIGATMGISENAAAQLIWRARAKLREAMTAGTVASVVAMSEECERAQLLLSMVQDGESMEEVDRVWLEEHLDECGSCKTANRLLLEIGASYRLWLPVALFAGMRTETLTRAGELVGADWSHVPTPGKGSAASSAGGGGGAGAAAGAVAAVTAAVVAVAGVGALTLFRDDEAAPVDRGRQAACGERAGACQEERGRRRQRCEGSGHGREARSVASLRLACGSRSRCDAVHCAGSIHRGRRARHPNAPPDSGSPPDSGPPDRPGQDRPGDPKDGPGKPPGDSPESDTPTPPGPETGFPVVPGPEIPAPVDSVPVVNPPPADPPADPTDPTNPTDPTTPRTQRPAASPVAATAQTNARPATMTHGDVIRPPGDVVTPPESRQP